MHYSEKTNRKSMTIRSSRKRKKNTEKPSGTHARTVKSKKRVVGPVSATKKKVKPIFNRGNNLPRFNVSKGRDASPSVSKYIDVSKWKNIIKGQPAFILGNAPSISDQNLLLLDDFFTIGVNRIFFIYDPTILIWQDKIIADEHSSELKICESVKFCRDIYDKKKKYMNFKLKIDPFKFSMKPGVLYGRGNTGILAAQLAVSMGCSSLVLIGTDCKYDGDKTDFYGKNEDHKKYTLKMCKGAMKWLKEKSPVPIYNCSLNELWDTVSVDEIIEELKPERLGKKYFDNLMRKGK